MSKKHTITADDFRQWASRHAVQFASDSQEDKQFYWHPFEARYEVVINKRVEYRGNYLADAIAIYNDVAEQRP